MDRICQYLLSVTAAAILCALIKTLVGKKTTSATMINLIAGIFIAVTAISPWVNFDLSGLADNINAYTASADAAVNSGTAFAQQETASIIKKQSEAYILDKARSLGLVAQVDVSLSQDSPPIPYAVTLQTDAAPYAKERLKQYISDHLGIPEARQTWI